MKEIIKQLRFNIFNSIIENEYKFLTARDRFITLEIDDLKVTFWVLRDDFINSFDVYLDDEFNKVIGGLYMNDINEVERLKAAKIIRKICKEKKLLDQ